VGFTVRVPCDLQPFILRALNKSKKEGSSESSRSFRSFAAWVPCKTCKSLVCAIVGGAASLLSPFALFRCLVAMQAGAAQLAC